MIKFLLLSNTSIQKYPLNAVFSFTFKINIKRGQISLPSPFFISEACKLLLVAANVCSYLLVVVNVVVYKLSEFVITLLVVLIRSVSILCSLAGSAADFILTEPEFTVVNSCYCAIEIFIRLTVTSGLLAIRCRTISIFCWEKSGKPSM